MSWTSVRNGPPNGGILLTSGAGATWSDDEEEVFRRLYTGGHDLEKIRERFGLPSVEAVTQRAYRRHLKRPSSIARKEKDDVATRLAVLLGEEARPAVERRLFSDEELLRFAGRDLEEDIGAWRATVWPKLEPWVVEPPAWLPAPDRLQEADAPGGTTQPADREGVDRAWAALRGLDLFAREALRLELMDHQLAMALCCLASRRALCLAGRQSGKDTVQAALALWEALVLPGSVVVLVSGGQRQSEHLMNRLLGLAAREGKVADSVLKSSLEKAVLTNDSEVHALPASGMIRGLTATRVLVNEARDVPNEEETYSAVEPMLVTTGGSLGVFTTPFGRQGRIWEAFHSPLYLRTRIPSRASRYARPEHLEAQRLEMSAALYACEYEAEFLDVHDSYFSVDSIQRCTREYDLRLAPEPGERYALGWDPARVRDSSVMVVVGRDEEDLVHVRYLKSFLGVPLQDQVAFVHHLHSVFRLERIVGEYAGLGIGPVDQLEAAYGRTVEAFRPSTERKALGYDTLKQRLERGTVVLPASASKLLAELRTLSYRITPSGSMTIHHPGGGSDDYADALMLANWAFHRDQVSGDRVRVIRANLWGRVR